MTSTRKTSRSGSPSLSQMFGANLQRARKKRRLSIDELARRCGYTPEYVQAVERGMDPELSLAEAETFAEALGVHIADLMKRNVRF